MWFVFIPTPALLFVHFYITRQPAEGGPLIFF